MYNSQIQLCKKLLPAAMVHSQIAWQHTKQGYLSLRRRSQHMVPGQQTSCRAMCPNLEHASSFWRACRAPANQTSWTCVEQSHAAPFALVPYIQKCCKSTSLLPYTSLRKDAVMPPSLACGGACLIWICCKTSANSEFGAA